MWHVEATDAADVLLYTGRQPTQQRIIWLKTSRALKLKNPSLGHWEMMFSHRPLPSGSPVTCWELLHELGLMGVDANSNDIC